MHRRQPVVSNGSMMTAPDAGRRIRAIRERGGKVVVIDPRRSETAAIADEHLAIRPGTDAALLLSLVAVLSARGRIDRDRLRAATDEAAKARLGKRAFGRSMAHR